MKGDATVECRQISHDSKPRRSGRDASRAALMIHGAAGESHKTSSELKINRGFRTYSVLPPPLNCTAPHLEGGGGAKTEVEEYKV